jgi:hypothetical protein
MGIRKFSAIVGLAGLAAAIRPDAAWYEAAIVALAAAILAGAAAVALHEARHRARCREAGVTPPDWVPDDDGMRAP